MASADSFYPIVGIQDGLGDKNQLLREVYLRLELDDWYQSQQLVHINQRALFFPAFWRFSQMKPQEKLSWFQIAGIHGKPFIAWDEPPQKGASKDKGYCTHNSILFSTWHRPYLLLFEQVIFELMKEEAHKYPDAEQLDLLEAARTWRLPYWDWALKKPVPGQPDKLDYNVPLVIQSKKVRIRLPTVLGYGDVSNAFYQFTMPSDMTMGDASLKNKDPRKDLRITKSEIQYPPKTGPTYTFPFDQCKATSRHPEGKGVNEDWVNGKQDNSAIVKDLRDYKWDPTNNTEDPGRGNLTASLRDAFYRLTTIENFEDFSTKRAPGYGAKHPVMKDFAFDSCENLHDNMHGWCGGDWTDPDDHNIRLMGHMSHVPLAAFDPIFWVHHCNVDRLIAIWQLLHEDSWFDGTDPRDEDLGTFSIPWAHPDRPQDSLRPFHNDTGKYWTSMDAREVTALGYTYPGLEKWKYTKPDGSYDQKRHIDFLNHKLNVDYNSAWAAAEKAELTADPNQPDGVGLMSLSSLQNVIKKDPIDLIGVDDYVVNVIYEKFALNGIKFTIHIFIGKVPDELPYSFQEPGSQVGVVVNFSTEPGSMGNSSDGCPNCRAQQEDHTESTGRVILTNALITRWKNQVQHEPEGDGPQTLASMNPADVVKFLTYNLHWRVTSMGTSVEVDRIPSLKVSVAVGKANHYADRTKPSRFYDYKGAHEVTQGRPGGAGPEDGLYPPGYEYSTGTEAPSEI